MTYFIGKLKPFPLVVKVTKAAVLKIKPRIDSIVSTVSMIKANLKKNKFCKNTSPSRRGTRSIKVTAVKRKHQINFMKALNIRSTSNIRYWTFQRFARWSPPRLAIWWDQGDKWYKKGKHRVLIVNITDLEFKEAAFISTNGSSPFRKPFIKIDGRSYMNGPE